MIVGPNDERSATQQKLDSSNVDRFKNYKPKLQTTNYNGKR